MGKMDCDVDLADTVRAFGHGPFRINAQTFARNVVPCAELPHKIPDTAGHRADKEFDCTHAGILTVVGDRMVCDDSMLAARDVVPCAAVEGHLEFHRAP